MNQDLTEGSPSRVLVSFCLPLFASIVFQQLYTIADSLVAGKWIGEHALASVGNSYEVTLVFLAVAFGCNMGCSVTASAYFGARQYGQMKTAIFTAMISSAWVCLGLMVIGLFWCDGLLLAMNTPLELMTDSRTYLDIYILGLPFLFFYNISTGIFTAMGDSRTPFWFLAVSSLSNIALDILFVTAFAMGVEGVAWATFLCQGVSCVLAMGVVLRRLGGFQEDTRWNLFSWEAFKQFARIAVPSTLQQSFISLGNIVIQSIINAFGSGVMAGYSAAIKLNNLVITAFTTVGNGISNYTGQNLGAGKPERVRQGFRAGLALVWLLCLPLSAAYLLWGKTLLEQFIEQPTEEAIESGIRFLRLVSPFYVVVSAKLVADGILRGAGKMAQFMAATFTDLLLRVVLAFCLSATALGYTGIWCAWPVGWSVACGMSLWFYHRWSRYFRKGC